VHILNDDAVKNILYLLFVLLYTGTINSQNEVEGKFYLFSNMGPIQMDIKPASLVMSVYDPESEELSSIDYTFKEEYSNKGFYYIAYNDVPDSRAVLKVKLEETGNYGVYYMGDFKKESSNWSIPNLKKEINRDTANVKIATLFSERNYQNSLTLKNNLTITDQDYITFYVQYVNEIGDMITKINSSDKKALSGWLYHHPYIQMSTISRLLISLGYQPLTDPQAFVVKVMQDPKRTDLINQLDNDTTLF